MEVDHDAMNRAAAANSKPTESAGNTAEHGASTAPQIVDSTTGTSTAEGASTSTKPVLGYQSGAIPDQYESYPEVVPQQEAIATHGQTMSPYPQSAAGYPPSSISPQSATPVYERYQTISPPPAQQTQPLMQEQYHSGPIPVESEKKGYYAPAFGGAQAAGYGNQPNPQGFDGSHSGSSYGKPGQAPPPGPYGSAAAPEKKILGMRKKIFWIVLAVIIIIIIAAAGAAAGIIISKKNKDNNVKPPKPDNPDDDDDNNNSGYTPYALTTGVRDMNLQFLEHQGSCNNPNVENTSNLVNCFAASRYQVRITGSVKEGYFLSSVNVQGRTFSNLPGTPPTTDDVGKAGSAWIFQDAFTESAGTICPISRITQYAFGSDDSVYAIGETFALSVACESEGGTTFPSGTQCTCVAVSSSAT